MTQTAQGAQKAVATIRKRYGDDFWRKAGKCNFESSKSPKTIALAKFRAKQLEIIERHYPTLKNDLEKQWRKNNVRRHEK